MAEKYRGWSLERIERELEQAQRDHDKLMAESAGRIADLMAARDAQAADDTDD